MVLTHTVTLDILYQVKHSEFSMSKPKQSPMMRQLYGETIAEAVYNRCQQMGEDFNKRVQEYVYDTIWGGNNIIDLFDKSLVTIVSLIISGKAEQLKIHFWGFLNQGGNPADVKDIIFYLSEKDYNFDYDNVISILEQAENEFTNVFGCELNEQGRIDVHETRLQTIIDYVACIVVGDNEKTKHCIKQALQKCQLSESEMKIIAQHAAVYCGFPVEMNALAVFCELENASIEPFS